MAGLGSRFKKAGYLLPKYMIEAKGRTLFECSMESLLDYNTYVNKYVFVVSKEDNATEFIREKCKLYNILNVAIVQIDYLTDGQATTCMLAIPYCDLEDAIMVYNIDTYVEAYEMKYEKISGNGHIPCFHSEGDRWSFVQLDEKGNMIEEGMSVSISIVDADKVHVLGTPEELQIFISD